MELRTLATHAGPGRSNLVRAVDKGATEVPLNPPAELFGEQGIIVLIVIAVVLFGSTQIPKLARSLGSAQKEFKKGLDEGEKGEKGSKADAKADAKAAAALTESAPETVQAPAPAPAPAATAPAAADGSADSTP